MKELVLKQVRTWAFDFARRGVGATRLTVDGAEFEIGPGFDTERFHTGWKHQHLWLALLCLDGPDANRDGLAEAPPGQHGVVLSSQVLIEGEDLQLLRTIVTKHLVALTGEMDDEIPLHHRDADAIARTAALLVKISDPNEEEPF